MNKVEEVTLQIIEASVFEKKINIDSDLPWQKIMQEFFYHGIVYLPVEFLRTQNVVPENIQKKWQWLSDTYLTRWYQTMEFEQETVKLLNKNDIATAVFKGSAIARFYNNPEMRSFGDVDLLVRRADYEKAIDIIDKNGYEFVKKNDTDVRVKKNGIELEVHFEPAGISELSTAEARQFVREKIQSGLDNIKLVKIMDYEIPVLPEDVNMLIYLLHIAKHFKEGVGLRQILDWMFFARNNLSSEADFDNQKEILRKSHLLNTAKVITKMCKKYLSLPDCEWCEGADETLGNDIMEFVMHQGNFGRKVEKEEYTADVLTRTKGIAHFIRQLQNNGKKNWKYAQNHKWVHPLAWVYQIGHYINKGLRKDKPLQSLIANVKEARKRKTMISKLKL